MHSSRPPSQRRSFIAAVLATVSAAACAVAPPAPYGPLPSERQLRRQRLEIVAFVHFGMNTFTDREWGDGAEDERTFDPSDFDAERIVTTLARAGMRGLILTTKHHDGFCLWPSGTTDHTVARSPWRDGAGDVVREFADACRRHGLPFGVYVSPWDRNHPQYGRPGYVTAFRGQLRELLTGYGPLFEVWFDGANGGSGHYGGARETRRIDSLTYYGWPETWQMVRDLQPGACIFSDAGPDLRWAGNERAEAGDPCWATIDDAGYAPGVADEFRLNTGDRPGTHWMPAECDVSTRPGWFHHPAEDCAVKTPEQLLDLYFSSVGRGALLLLNVPPDRRGRIADGDAQALRGFRRLRDATFAHDLAREARVSASSTRGRSRRFAPGLVADGRDDTYWATDDGAAAPELVLDFGRPVTFRVVRLREYTPLGQRVEAFALDARRGERWTEIATGTGIGIARLLRFPPVTADALRLRIVAAPVCPAIAEVAIFE